MLSSQLKSSFLKITFLLDAANDAAAEAEESKDPNRLLRLS